MDEFGLPSKFLIDGIDRLGKSSLIEHLQQELGYFLVIHYDKPKLLANLIDVATMILDSKPEDTDFIADQHLDVNNMARKLYQEETNRGMFDLMKTDTPVIFDRTHLGELVYAPMYRKYSGEYVFEFEKDYIESKPYTHQNNSRLILLITSNFDMLVDDGLSFDPNKKQEEQSRFIEAFNKSNIVNKVMIDIHDGNGGYRSHKEILEEALYKPYEK